MCIMTAPYCDCGYSSSPVVAQVHTIRVEHGYDFKDHMITQDLCHRVLAHQEVDKTYKDMHTSEMNTKKSYRNKIVTTSH